MKDLTEVKRRKGKRREEKRRKEERREEKRTEENRTEEERRGEKRREEKGYKSPKRTLEFQKCVIFVYTNTILPSSVDWR